MRNFTKSIIAFVFLSLFATLITTGQTVPTENKLYSFARYDSIGALAAAGVAPTRLNIALIQGGDAKFDGKGSFYSWDATSTTSTNGSTLGYTVVAADGVTTGRWLRLETRAGVAANIGILSGSITTAADGTVTNVFSTAYDSAPTVFVVQTGTTTSVTNVITKTATQFIWNAGTPSLVGKWLAIP